MKTVIRNFLILLCAVVASIGTYPYAKNFANHVFLSSQSVLFATVVFVSTAVLANIALSVFSILDTLRLWRKIPRPRILVIGMIALVAALATGFICVVGYYDTLPLRVNIVISIMVTLVNAAIFFSAIHNAFSHFFNKSTLEHSGNPIKKLIILLTMSGALMASFVFYLATVNGLYGLVTHFHRFEGYQNLVTYLFSILVWLPGAALFVNASRITMSEYYDKLTHKDLSVSFTGLVILVIAIFSGSSYAQMTIEFFDPSKQIPEFFRFIASHNTLVFYVIMPTTFIISGLVNAYALTKVVSQKFF